MASQDGFRRRSWGMAVVLNVFMAGLVGNPGNAIGADVSSSLAPGSQDIRTSLSTTDQKSGEPQDEPGGGDEPGVAEPELKPLAERPTLQWSSPFTRVDGSKLYPGEISGYRVYYRLRHQDKYRSLVVEGPGAVSLELAAFEAGDYEFAVSTLDVDGLESRRSNPVSVNLPAVAGE